MPIYEYKCESCSALVEKIQKFSDPPLTDCPTCGKAALVRLISAPSFRLKGSGWYETDFKTGKKKHGTGEDTGSGAGKDSAAKPETKSESAATPAKTGTE